MSSDVKITIILQPFALYTNVVSAGHFQCFVHVAAFVWDFSFSNSLIIHKENSKEINV